MDKLKKICICSVDELVHMLKHGLFDVEHSFAILSLSRNLTAKEGIISTMAHCACEYKDIDFDFGMEGLSQSAAKDIATDIIRRVPTVRRWYFVEQDGYRRSAAMCCAFLRYLGCEKEELELWQQTEVEVNVSVYSLMCRSLGITLEKGDLNRRMHANYDAFQSTPPTEWEYTRFVHWHPADSEHLENTHARRSVKEIHELFQSVGAQLDQMISKIGEFIEEERAMGYGETESSHCSRESSTEDRQKREAFDEASIAFKWSNILHHMEERLGAVTVSAWFDQATVKKFTWDQLIIDAGSDFRRVVIERRCLDYIRKALAELYGCNAAVSIISPTCSVE